MRVVVLASIFVLLAVTLVPTLRSYLRQQGEIDALRGQVSEQRQGVEDLQKEQARWHDDAYVMQQARERLKFVKVGEKSYTVIDGKPSTKALPGVAKAPAASSDHPWYGQLWESVQVADAGPAATATGTSGASGTDRQVHVHRHPGQVSDQPTQADLDAVQAQLGRVPRGVAAVAHRCPCGHPDVLKTEPRLP